MNKTNILHFWITKDETKGNEETDFLLVYFPSSVGKQFHPYWDKSTDASYIFIPDRQVQKLDQCFDTLRTE